jgi:hypothetical protein
MACVLIDIPGNNEPITAFIGFLQGNRKRLPYQHHAHWYICGIAAIPDRKGIREPYTGLPA